MKPRISMITLGVADLDRSTRFYEQGLGLPRMPLEADVSFFTLDGSWLALYPRDLLAADIGCHATGSGFAGFTLAHNLGSPVEVNALIDRAVAAGAVLVKQPADTDWGGYSGYFADPDGYLWEVAWNPHFRVGPQDRET